MLFAIDVGNTNITVGLFDGKKLIDTFRMTTGISRTSDEYGLFFGDWLTLHAMDESRIDAVIIASVVPNVMHSLTSGIIKYLHIQPVIVAPGIKTGINVMIPNPKALGADRLVDAVAAYELYGGPVIVIDFGTATTHDLVLADGSFHSGVTSPGIRLAASALWTGAAKLPEIEIRKPDSILAKDTVSSMQAGIFYGYIGQTEYIIRKMKEAAGLDNIKVVATGGLGKLISENTDTIDIYDANLTLQGLRLIFEKQ
ncbi:MAG: type III pantothenate kinase [Lachnospiraceae bacterium]|nr:type III pantothenate kinase [Lachnospiraceae bacterium]